MEWSTPDWSIHLKDGVTQWYAIFRLDRYGGSLQITDGMGVPAPRDVVTRLRPTLEKVLLQGMGLLVRY